MVDRSYTSLNFFSNPRNTNDVSPETSFVFILVSLRDSKFTVRCEPYRNELRTELKKSLPTIAEQLSDPNTLKHLSPYIREQPERKQNPGWKNIEEFNKRRERNRKEREKRATDEKEKVV
jgi:hypothetical protein